MKDLISGIPLHSCPKMEILQCMDRNIQNDRKPLHISITNTESMYYAKRIPEHLAYIKSATFSLCDGVGAVISGKFHGKSIKRLNGPDLLLEACKYGQNKNWRHFFCGGKDGIADLLVVNLRKKYPKIEIAGTYCPPFRELTKREELDMINKIIDAKPDLIWVGLGLIKQESWISKYKNSLNIPWFVGVGAAFDFYAGTVKRAPKFYRKIGFEWLYRLIREPRMFKRNVNSYIFMFSSIGDGFKQKFKKR